MFIKGGKFFVEITLQVSELWTKIGFSQVTQNRNRTKTAVLPNQFGNLKSGTNPTLFVEL